MALAGRWVVPSLLLQLLLLALLLLLLLLSLLLALLLSKLGMWDGCPEFTQPRRKRKEEEEDFYIYKLPIDRLSGCYWF